MTSDPPTPTARPSPTPAARRPRWRWAQRSSRPTTITVSLAACEPLGGGPRRLLHRLRADAGAGAIYHYLAQRQAVGLPRVQLQALRRRRLRGPLCVRLALSAIPGEPYGLQGREDEYALQRRGRRRRHPGRPLARRGLLQAGGHRTRRCPPSLRRRHRCGTCARAARWAADSALSTAAASWADCFAPLAYTGQRGPAAPPSPPPPPPPPAPSPSPSPPGWRWLGASESCYVTGTYLGPQCRDGGPHSLAPTLCTLGTQARVCGPRVPEVRNGDPMPGDDSCGSVNGCVAKTGLEGALGYEAADGDGCTTPAPLAPTPPTAPTATTRPSAR